MLQLDFGGLKVIDVTTSNNTTSVLLAPLGDVSTCPTCGSDSAHVHSRYTRQVRDLPIQGRPVTVTVMARRFRCLVQHCKRQTFSEPLEALARRHARRTNRLTDSLLALILELSSRAGTKLAEHMGIHTSPSTLLRVVEQYCRVLPTPRVLGVDDFALRRGRTYGTILCDLETGQPVDILLGRKAEPLATWLKAHPGVEVVVRDRACAYADAVRTGAPDVIQVADRFHLVRNVAQALQDVLDQQAWSLPTVEAPSETYAETCAVAELAPPCTPKVPLRQQELAAGAQQRKRMRYDEIHRQHQSGASIRAISRSLGLARPTVLKYLYAADVPQRRVRRRVPRQTDPFIDHLRKRWQSGCHNARRLFQELVDLGYVGSEASVRRLVAAWRTSRGKTPQGPHHTRKAPEVLSPTWRELRWLTICPREHLRSTEIDELQRFLDLHPELARAYGLVQSFRTMLRAKRVAELDTWLAAASSSHLKPFERLARTLGHDRMAVLAGIELRWSTGPVEGQITRVKLIKRKGYGRAGFALLKARILGAA